MVQSVLDGSRSAFRVQFSKHQNPFDRTIGIRAGRLCQQLLIGARLHGHLGDTLPRGPFQKVKRFSDDPKEVPGILFSEVQQFGGVFRGRHEPGDKIFKRQQPPGAHLLGTV